jgi:predicted amidohydrolase
MASTSVRIALANLPNPTSPADALERTLDAVRTAGANLVDLICFPECYVPGYRTTTRDVAPPDESFLEQAWSQVAAAAAAANVAVILGTERMVDDQLRISALVVDRDGSMAGFQDKVQLDPSEEATYSAGTERRVFQTGALVFGVSICHEAWRYPETVRFAARRGARIVFVPHFHEAEPGSYRPRSFADPANTFHEKAILCRAAENTCFVAAANCASAGSPTTSAVAGPDGSLLAWQPYGKTGLLIVDLNLDEATGVLASRYKPLA